MEITGKIIAALEPRGGVSQRTGNSWKTQEFVIETHEQYPRKCVFNVFGEDRLREFNIQVGEELTVSFDIDAREFNGRWYTDVSAYSAQPIDLSAPAPMGGVAPAAPQSAAPQPAAPTFGQTAAPTVTPDLDPLGGGDSGNDDLPF